MTKATRSTRGKYAFVTKKQAHKDTRKANKKACRAFQAAAVISKNW